MKRREIIVDWLHEIGRKKHLRWQTILIACQIFDRFLYFAPPTIEPVRLRLICITAACISAKIEEIHPPKIAWFAAEGKTTVRNISRMEAEIMETLEWSVSLPTPFDFLSA